MRVREKEVSFGGSKNVIRVKRRLFRHARLQIDEFDVRFVSLDQFGRFAEHVSSAQRCLVLPGKTFLVLSFGQARVLDRRGTEPLADFQRTRTRHDGVYATPGHEIASEEESQENETKTAGAGGEATTGGGAEGTGAGGARGAARSGWLVGTVRGSKATSDAECAAFQQRLRQAA